MLDRLAGYLESDEGNNLNRLMRGHAKSAVGIRVSGRMAMRRLHESNHQHQRDANNPNKNYPGRSRAQL